MLKISTVQVNLSDKAVDEFCGTSYAANLLGLSVGTIQSLVEKNILQAWKTRGGHRRISMDSLREYQKNKRANTSPNVSTIGQLLRVLLVDDDNVTREMFRRICDKATMPIDCTAMSSGMEALIDIATIQPHILITDLDMPGIDGFELLHILNKNPQFESMAILAYSGLTWEEVQARGGIPTRAIYLSKPTKADWFNGFFAGVMVGAENKKKTHALSDNR